MCICGCVCVRVSAEDMFSVDGNETQVALRDLKPSPTNQLHAAAGTRASFGDPSEWTFSQTPNLSQGNK